MGRSAVSRETGRAQVQETQQGGRWVRLCDAAGKLQATYDPTRGLLCIRERGHSTIHNLRQHDPHCQSSTSVLG